MCWPDAYRYQIQAHSELDFSARAISRKLKRSNKTVSEELKRCPGGDYCAEVAHRHAGEKRQQAQKAQKFSEIVMRHVDWLLSLGLSPEQIAGRMQVEDPEIAVSRQTIYRYVACKHWRARLPRKGKRYRQR